MRQLLLFTLTAVSLPAQQQFINESLAPYLPTPQVVVDRMLNAAAVRPGEILYDLGCGDGRVVITAAQKFRARAVGIEIQPLLAKSTAKRVADLGLESLVKIVQGNVMTYDLSPADIVTLFLLTSSNEKLRPVFDRSLKPGARVVSYAFEIPGWQPVLRESFQVEKMIHTIYLYEVPAKTRKK